MTRGHLALHLAFPTWSLKHLMALSPGEAITGLLLCPLAEGAAPDGSLAVSLAHDWG